MPECGTAASPRPFTARGNDRLIVFFSCILSQNPTCEKRLKSVISSGDEWTGLAPVPYGEVVGTDIE